MVSSTNFGKAYQVLDITDDQTELIKFVQEANMLVTYLILLTNTSKKFMLQKRMQKDGTPGIRTVFENIKSLEVFTVVFQKQDRPKTKKQLETEREVQRQEAIQTIDKAKRLKRSMATAYKRSSGIHSE